MPQYIVDNTDDEFSHTNFLFAYLKSKGASTSELDLLVGPYFRTIPGSTATGSANKGRLTNLTKLTVDTSFCSRYRSDNVNPDLGDTGFIQAVPSLNVGQHTAIPKQRPLWVRREKVFLPERQLREELKEPVLVINPVLSDPVTPRRDAVLVTLPAEIPNVSLSLRSASGRESIREAQRWVLLGQGFASAEEAQEMGMRLQDALIIALSKARIAADPAIGSGRPLPGGRNHDHDDGA
jgi:hypothetical protein